MTVPNATEFTVHRWFEGISRTPVFKVTWENSWAFEDDNGDYDNDEQESNFDTLEEALAFGKQLIEAKLCEGCGETPQPDKTLCAECELAEAEA